MSGLQNYFKVKENNKQITCSGKYQEKLQGAPAPAPAPRKIRMLRMVMGFTKDAAVRNVLKGF